MDSYLQILPIYRYADMEKLYLLSADIYRQAYLQILSADIIIGRTLMDGHLKDMRQVEKAVLCTLEPF